MVAKGWDDNPKASVLRGLIRKKLINAGNYTEAKVETIFGKITDKGNDLSFVKWDFTDKEKVQEINKLVMEKSNEEV